MRLPPLPIAALVVSLMTASCASYRPPVTAPPPPLPAEYAVRCPSPPPAAVSPEVDAVAISLKQMYDLYGLCAGRLVDLLDYLEGARR